MTARSAPADIRAPFSKPQTAACSPSSAIPTARAGGAALEAEFGDRLILVANEFGNMAEAAEAAGLTSIDGVVLDIGVSSMQLDNPERGFSFMRDGPLDMRMSQNGPSAADVVNTMDEEDLANVLYELGEERRSRAIARTIVKARGDAPITTTKALVGRRRARSGPRAR